MIFQLLILEPLTPAILLLRSSDSHPVLFCIIGLCVGLFLFVQGFRLLQRRRLILDTPLSKIRSASLGMVELSGLAAGPYTMIAPITDHPCFYYRTLAWEWKQCGKNKQWVKVAAECMHVPFFLDDNTGKVMVDPRGAELDLHRDFQQEFCDGFFTTKQEAPPNVHRFLSRHGVSTTNKIKVEEFCIKPKNALFLLGTLSENPGLEVTPHPIQDTDATTLTVGGASFSLGSGALSFRMEGSDGFNGELLATPLFRDPASDKSAAGSSTITKPIEVIHLSPASGPTSSSEMTQQQKVAAALLKAGIASPAAWAAHVTASTVVANGDPIGVAQSSAENDAQARPPSDGFDPHPPVVLMKGKNNPTFLISWRSQRDVARSLGWKCTLMIWGGPALVLLCLYALHNITHWF